MKDADTFEDISKACNNISNKLAKTSISNEDNTIAGVAETSSSLNIDVEVFDRIANKLLKSGLYLTALELHAELSERGKELPRLREYFDDAKNFEKCTSTTVTSKNRQDLGGTSGMSNLLVPRSLTPHTSSDQTFDSFDFTHYSDEDLERPGDEKIAVLEFELRKANQTINSLRACLTTSQTGQPATDDFSDVLDVTSNVTAGCSSSFASKGVTEHLAKHLDLPPPITSANIPELSSFLPESTTVGAISREFYQRGSADGDSCPGEEDKFTHTNRTLSDSVSMFEHGQESSSLKYSLASSIKLLEKRAINFLINEYLLANNYKLSSITLCDEVADQDFDKWDDVGLNIDRPPDLLKLYRHYWHTHCHSNIGLTRTLSNATTVVNSNINQSTD